MEIWAIFNDENFFSALVQGQDFEERGDEQWQNWMNTTFRHFGRSEDEFILISEDDLALYMQGYTRGEDGKPVPPPPTPANILADRVDSKYATQIKELKDALSTAMLMGDDELVDELKAEYNELMSQYQQELEAIENEM